jgi:hypothetical protein
MEKTVITFNKPFTFEGKEYKSVDLTGINDLSTADLITAQSRMERSGTQSILPELNYLYICIICSLATKLPEEFFKALPAKEGIKLKNVVSANFFNVE